MNPQKDAVPIRVLHTLPGRLRIHSPAWRERDPGVEKELRSLAGVRGVHANPATGNILVQFDPAITSADEIRAAAAASSAQGRVHTALNAAAQAPESGLPQRLRITVRGLADNPALARSIEARLSRHEGVRVTANPLTGRVLLIVSADVEVQPLLAELCEFELPDLPSARPSVDPHVELINATVRLGAALAGLGVIGYFRLRQRQQPGESVVRIAATLNIVPTIPGLPQVLEHLLGRQAAVLLLTLPRIVLLTAARGPFGLIVIAAEALSEIEARRRQGTALERGPSLNEWYAHDEWAEPYEGLTRRYISVISPTALLFALFAGLATRSFDRALVALLLLSTRPATLGSAAVRRHAATALAESSDVVQARNARPLVRPDVLLVERPGVLANGVAIIGIGEETIFQPRIYPAARKLKQLCDRNGIELVLAECGDAAVVQDIANRLGVTMAKGDPAAVLRNLRAAGKAVIAVSTAPEASHLLAAAHFGIAIGSRAEAFEGRADLLVPDLDTIGAVLELALRAHGLHQSAVGLSIIANVAGVIWSLSERLGIRDATRPGNFGSLAALVMTWLRMEQAGQPERQAALKDTHPERWAGMPAAEVLRIFRTREDGLSAAEAAERRVVTAVAIERSPLITALVTSVRSPLTAFVLGALGLTLLQGPPLDVMIMGFTLIVNIAVSAWQEYSVNRVSTQLRRLSMSHARVLRAGEPLTVEAGAVVPGDLLLIAAGERIVADARLLRASGLEVDESSLTGESLPVRKSADASGALILLDGTDVIVGHGRAIVVAVGDETRMGVTALAAARHHREEGPLGNRLGQLFQQVLPVTIGGGAVVALAGLARGQKLVPQLVAGASVALAALPEALPVLAGLGQAAAARRLAGHNVRVHRASAIEALGRVDVACVDKTGTMTEGRLAVHVIETLSESGLVGPNLSEPLRNVLLAAALASPHPDADDAASHSTDVAVLRAAETAGLAIATRAARVAEARFDQARAFHAARVDGRLVIKGAPEVLVPACSAVLDHEKRPLDDAGRDALLARARDLGERGFRVIMVAEGPPDGDLREPRDLVALGFLALSDALREGVAAAVQRCHAAGVRVVMLTGDHPATARAIAEEAGLLDTGLLLTGAQMAALDNHALDARIDRVSVIARANPLDKVRIIESLRRVGRTIAMTGDGINDAAALRLADVGVAMGRGGTEVARQAADCVLLDDNFESLVEALIEGRSFWRNLRRSLALLLGGNLGELGYITATTILGLGVSLTVRQILATNLITDALPAVAVAVQPPEQRRLAGLEREGAASLGAELEREVRNRAFSTAVPALAAALLASVTSSVAVARTVGFASIVTSQLALTVQAGRAQGNLTAPVIGATTVSGGALLTLLAVPSLRRMFDLALPGPIGWGAIAASTAAAVALKDARVGTA